jgi:pyruvate formate lyase activating enzyme
MATGLIFDIKRYSVHDGPGIRTTVFFKGCPLECWWCHNPESRDPDPLLYYDAEKCLGCHDCVAVCPEGAVGSTTGGSTTDTARCVGHGACAAACPTEARQLIGRRYTVEDLVHEIARDQVFYEESGGGVTFSGGEPLLQWEFLLEVLKACGELGIHRTVDTTGVATPEVLLAIAEEAELFLYDIKVMDPAVHKDATGVHIRPILNNLVRLLASGARVRIRIPLVPGITDGDNVEQVATFLLSLDGLDGVHLLPYHAPARDKHLKFGVPWQLPDDLAMPPGQAEVVAQRMRSQGLSVTVGG